MEPNLGALQALPLKEVAAGNVIIEEGSKVDALYFLENGMVEVLKGDTQVATERERGAVFGEMSLLLQSEATATVRTLRDSTFHIADDAWKFLDAHPEITVYVATTLARRLQAVTQYLADVKHQFPEKAGHLGMVDEILDVLMHRQPRRVERAPDRGH